LLLVLCLYLVLTLNAIGNLILYYRSMAASSFSENFLRALQDDRVKKNLHDIFETSIKLLIDEQFAAIKHTVDGLNASIDLLRNEV